MYRHLKSGRYYEVIVGEFFLHEFSEEGSVHYFVVAQENIVATLECSTAAREKSKYAGPVILYKGLDSKYWLRPPFEFHDGRFEKVGLN